MNDRTRRADDRSSVPSGVTMPGAARGFPVTILRLGLVVFILTLAVAGCIHEDDETTVLLAVTTSVDHTGLLDAVAAAFADSSSLRLEWVTVGTGQALELGRNGDVDAVLVHGGQMEEAFISGGWGVDRRPVMYNEFLIAGPPDDPAGVAPSRGAVEAFRRIAEAEAGFVSRGDDSGTHLAERQIWEQALEALPRGRWYLEVGQGMAGALRVAAARGAYILTDRATLAVLGEELELTALVSGDPLFHNQYSVIRVNPERHPRINGAGARVFVEWITSPEGQAVIGEFRVQGSDRPLFVPSGID